VSTQHPETQPQARYILPSFIEHSSFGVKESNPYNKLFEERIIFLGVQVDDASANDIMAQLLVLESLDPDRDITMYINSPGGGFTSLMAIYDTMQYVRADIQTVCQGLRDHRHRPGVSEALRPVRLTRRRTCTHRESSTDFSRSLHARRTSAMSEGPTRQQPPTMRAPAAAHCTASFAENRRGPIHWRRRLSQRSPLLG